MFCKVIYAYWIKYVVNAVLTSLYVRIHSYMHTDSCNVEDIRDGPKHKFIQNFWTIKAEITDYQ